MFSVHDLVSVKVSVCVPRLHFCSHSAVVKGFEVTYFIFAGSELLSDVFYGTIWYHVVPFLVFILIVFI